MLGLLVFTSQGQQVHLDPTGAGEATLSKAFSVIATNSYVVAGTLFSPSGDCGFVTRFSKTDVLWSKKFQTGTSLESMAIASNGDIVVAGLVSVLGGTGLVETSMLVARLNISGDTLWTTKVSTDAKLDLACSIVVDQDGTILVGGLSGLSNNRQQLVVRLSADGDIVENAKQQWVPHTHTLDEVFVRNSNIFIFGVERVGSFSSGNISLKVLGPSFSEVDHKVYGNIFASDDVPSVVMLNQGAFVATTASNGFGFISLNQDFDIVSSSSLRFQEASGAILQNPRLVQDESGYLYLGGMAFPNTATDSSMYAIVSKIDPVSLSVLWTRTINRNGFVSGDMGFDGSALVVPSARGASVTLSFVDKETGQIVGTPCDIPLPSFALETTPYPNLAEFSLTPFNWLGSSLTQVDGFDQSQLPLEIDDCEPILLPVELTYFTARVEGEKVTLLWTTATEHNNSHFVIERSKDLESWETVEVVTGQGDSQSATNYEARDEQPYSGTSYYRLKQVDFDGTHNYSQAVSVSVREHEFVLSPNPITSGQVLRGVGNREFQIINLGGQIVYQGRGESSVSLPSGTYVVRLVGDETQSMRLQVTN